MDIDYLLFLQNLRDQAPGWINQCAIWISDFIISPIIFLLPLVVFWSVSKRAGIFLYMSTAIQQILCGLFKNFAAVYRPWIKDPRVNTMLKASAGGYSFPSGHTGLATTFYGGIGVLLSKFKKWLIWPFVILILLTGFSRNWLGCHYPQDVIGGLVTGVLSLVAAWYALKWVDKHPTLDWVVALVGIAVSILIMLFIYLKPYPITYTANETMLVVPATQYTESFSYTAMLMAFFIGWIVERRAIRFTMNVPVWARIVRSVIGCILFVWIYTNMKDPLVAGFGDIAGRIIYGSTVSLFPLVVYPCLFVAFERCFLKNQDVQEPAPKAAPATKKLR